jgi:uncharacterized protein YfaS (alpha-2-macroglobulin family)
MGPLQFVREHKALLIKVALGIIFIVVLVLVFFGRGAPAEVPKSYTEAYVLVADKISKSAHIAVHLPKGTDPATVSAQNVTFEPQIKGTWVATSDASTLVFDPSGDLDLGKHYEVKLTLATGEMSKDFLVDENPEIVSIFPKEGSEADEHSAITIIFNRPMVPLTTLSELESKDVPVEITPATEGTFKWISTRNLQFIPTTRLHYAAHYSVKVKDGLVSTDGLHVKGKTHTFTTRPLRFLSVTQGEISYQSPVQIRFNEPVDLNRTIQKISLVNTTSGIAESFTAEYDFSFTYDKDGKPTEKIVDRSVINLFSRQDRFGRAKFWDTKTAHRVEITEVFPLDGDITHKERITGMFNVGDIVRSISAQSPRTTYAAPDFFDPQGSLTLHFYESINLGSSRISGKGVSKVSYAQICAPTTGVLSRFISDKECDKVNDTTTLIVTFTPGAFTPGEKFDLLLERIENSEGVTITGEMLPIHLTVYPKLVLTRSSPSQGLANAKLTELLLCSNTPLNPITPEEYKKSITSSARLIFRYTQPSYRVMNDQYNNDYNKPCEQGEFITRISYGLLPQTEYQLKLTIEDVFGNSAIREMAFATGAPEVVSRRIFGLQRQYNVTTPDKTKLTFAAENLEYVNVSICKVNPEQMLRYMHKPIDPATTPEALNCAEEKQTTIDLPDTYWVNNYFQVDLAKFFEDPRGNYIVSIGHPNYKDVYGRSQPIFERSIISVTNLAVGEKKTNWSKYDNLATLTERAAREAERIGSLYWVSNSKTLAPISGAAVTLYRSEGEYPSQYLARGQTGSTNTQGVAAFSLEKDLFGATVTIGDETAIVSGWGDSLGWSGSLSSAERLYLYTDRPIYRPTHTVHIKGLYRFDFDGALEILDGKEFTVSVFNPKNEVVKEQRVVLNQYGTFSFDLTLPQDAPLGHYRIQALDYSFGTFDVEEYVGAPFALTVKSDKEEYISGDSVDATIDARYYFGAPVDGGTVTYSFTTQNYYFDRFQDEYFNFDGGWYYCYDCGYGDRFIGSGQVELQSDGTAKISQAFDLKKLFASEETSYSKIVTLHATVKDKNGKSVTSTKSFIIHKGEFYMGLKSDSYFASEKQPITIRAKTVDTKGAGVSAKGLKLVINKVEWKSFKRQEVDGGFYSRYERVLTKVDEDTIKTNGSGDWSDEVSLDTAGEYEVSLSGTDERGNQIVAKTNLYIYGAGAVSVRPSNNATLEIEAGARDVKVGDTPKLIIKSPTTRGKALISIERGGIFEYKIVDVNQNFYSYQFNVLPSYVPNIFVSALLLSPEPAVKFGQVEYKVNREYKALSIDITAEKKFYLPGEKVRLTVRTSDSLKRPVQAEVSLAVADMSVLALKGNQKKNPLVFFYNGLPLTVTTASNIKNILEEVPIPTGGKGGDGAGESAEDLAKKKRGEFKDTAFWQGEIETNTEGIATVEFTLPDNLTLWQAEAVGITKNSLVGAGYQEFTAKKNVMAVPLKPRFVIPGDKLSLGAHVFNQTETKQRLSVTLTSPTLGRPSGASWEESVTLDPGASETVYFDVSAPTVLAKGSHTFTISAKNADFEDVVDQTIPIRENVTYETTATAAMTDAASVHEQLFVPDDVLSDRGGLTVKANATLAVFLPDALKYMAQFPYGCSEQLASKIASLAIVEKALKVKNLGALETDFQLEFEGQKYTLADGITQGLSRLYGNQLPGGGFTYYQGLEANLNLSVHVLNALIDIKEAGFPVREDVIRTAATFVANETLRQNRLKPSTISPDGIVMAAYTLSRLTVAPSGYSGVLSAVNVLTTSSFLSEGSSSNTLGYLALLSHNAGFGEGEKARIYKALQNRIDIDSRGAYVKQNPRVTAWGYYETPVKDTALFIKLLAISKQKHELTDKLLRYIGASRGKDGSWGSTNTTLAVIDALTAYLKTSGEADAAYALSILLDGASQGEHTFDAKTVFSTFKKFIPMSEIKLGKVMSLELKRTQKEGKALGNLYYDASLTYFLPAEHVAPRDEGISIERSFYSLTDKDEASPLTKAKIGDVIRGKILVTSAKPRALFAVEDFLPAGLELVNFELATEDQTLNDGNDKGYPYPPEFDGGHGLLPEAPVVAATPASRGGILGLLGLAGSSQSEKNFKGPERFADDIDFHTYHETLYPDFKELHDDRLFIFRESLPAGEYVYEYYARVTTPGTFQHPPAVASELYFPENFGRTGGETFTVEK